MQHRIDPKIDCVFKALLGSEGNRRLLIHFLNAALGDALPAPVVEAEILNPYNEREFLDDKLSIVDVKARDAQGRLFQVEIQLLEAARRAHAAQEQARAAEEQARGAEEQARAAEGRERAALQREAGALAEIERLRRLLKEVSAAGDAAQDEPPAPDPS